MLEIVTVSAYFLLFRRSINNTRVYLVLTLQWFRRERLGKWLTSRLILPVVESLFMYPRLHCVKAYERILFVVFTEILYTQSAYLLVYNLLK